MSSISLGTGLISGLNTSQIVEALITAQRGGAARMESQIKSFQGRQAALQALQAALLPLLSAGKTLQNASTFKNFAVTNSAPTQLTVAAGSAASAGDYAFRTVRTARTDEVVSIGAANADQQTFGAGTILITTAGGELRRSTSLNVLNGGDGVRRGSIRITDRSGASAVIDLKNAVNVDDVLAAINDNADIAVTATSEGGRLLLTDTTGSTTSNLIVAEVGGGRSAADLGLLGSVAATTLEGSDVFQVTGDFRLEQLNDGNAIRRVTGTDLRITLTDDTVLDVDLDGASTIDDVLAKINDHDDNTGKLAATLSNGRIVLEDQSGGGGSSAFAIENQSGASVVRELGLDTSPAGDTITGRRVVAGIGSILLSNLRGGRGIDEIGELSLRDRAGNSATIDLTGAESLDEVLNAINAARTTGDVKLEITARLNALGNGLEIIDTSGATASNLIIEDVGGSTLADQLGIAVDGAVTSVDSSSLSLRHVNEATSLSKYRLNGAAVRVGSFRITDSSGASAVVTIASSEKTIGDVLSRINAATGISVTARLNDDGDGIAIIDDAGGATALSVASVAGSAAADLRLIGTGTLNGDGDYEINARRALRVDVEAGDTLNAIRSKINSVGGLATASVINTGNPIKPVRLLLRASQSGDAGRLIVDDGALDLGFTSRVRGTDAVLQVGQDPESSTYLTSTSNTFSEVAAGITVTAVSAGETAATISVSRDDSQVESGLKSFVSSYNAYLQSWKDSTKFDFAANQRGVLQGDGFILRLQSRIESILNARYAPESAGVRTLQDLGITVGADGKLALDTARLSESMTDHRAETVEFFQKATTGFAARITTTLDEMTNVATGRFKTETDQRQLTIDALAARVKQIDTLLVVRKDRLIRQFAKMEEALSLMQSNQNSISGIQRIEFDRPSN